jgi:hypothetical protein
MTAPTERLLRQQASFIRDCYGAIESTSKRIRFYECENNLGGTVATKSIMK